MKFIVNHFNEESDRFVIIIYSSESATEIGFSYAIPKDLDENLTILEIINDKCNLVDKIETFHLQRVLDAETGGAKISEVARLMLTAFQFKLEQFQSMLRASCRIR